MAFCVFLFFFFFFFFVVVVVVVVTLMCTEADFGLPFFCSITNLLSLC